MGLRAPAQHAAREIGDIGKFVLLQNGDGLSRTAAGATNGDYRAVAAQFADTSGELAERNEDRAGDVAERPVELVGLAHVEDLHVLRMLLEPVRIDFPNSR